MDESLTPDAQGEKGAERDSLSTEHADEAEESPEKLKQKLLSQKEKAELKTEALLQKTELPTELPMTKENVVEDQERSESGRRSVAEIAEAIIGTEATQEQRETIDLIVNGQSRDILFPGASEDLQSLNRKLFSAERIVMTEEESSRHIPESIQDDLIQAINAYPKERQQYEKLYNDALMPGGQASKALRTVSEAAGLTNQKDLGLLSDIFLSQAPIAPPPEADDKLFAMHDAIFDHMFDLKDDAAAIIRGEDRPNFGKDFQAYQDMVNDFEAAVTKMMIPVLKEKLDLRKSDTELVSDADAVRFFDELRRPVAKPILHGNSSPEVQKRYDQHYKWLMQMQENLVTRNGGLDDILERVRDGYLVEDKEYAQFTEDAVLFVTERDNYEASLRGDMHEHKWYEGLLHFAAFGAALDGTQQIFNGIIPHAAPEPSPRSASKADKELIDALKKQGRSLEEASTEVAKRLRARGITDVPPIEKVTQVFEQSPMKDFFETFKHFNAIDYVLMAYIMYLSDNKTKSALEFAGIMAAGTGANALLVAAEKSYTRTALAALQRGDAVAYRRYSKLAKVPGHPALKFAFIIAATYAGAEYIHKGSEWIDEHIPDSALKDTAGDVMHTVSFGPIADLFSEVNAYKGNINVDQEEARMDFLRKKGGIARKMHHSFVEWNEVTAAAIEKLDSPLTEALFALEKIDLPDGLNGREGVRTQEQLRELMRDTKRWKEVWKKSTWVQREVAKTYSTVSYLREQETDFAERAKKLGVSMAMPSLVQYVISEDVSTQVQQTLKEQWTEGETVRSVDQMFLREFSPSLGAKTKYRAYEQAIVATGDKDLIEEWHALKHSSVDLAKGISVYRYNRVYDKEEWFGKNIEPTGLVRKGLTEEVVYRLKRREALAFHGNTNVTEHGNALAEMTRPGEAAFDGGALGILSDMTSLTAMIEITLSPEQVRVNARDANAKLQLRNALAQGTRTLTEYFKGKTNQKDVDAINGYLKPVSDIVLHFRTRGAPTFDDLNMAREAVAKSVAYIEALQSGEKLRDADAKDRERYGFGKTDCGNSCTAQDMRMRDTEVLVAGAHDETSKSVIERAFRHDIRTPESGKHPFRDIVLLESTPPPNARVVTMTSFDCHTPDRRKWRVKTNTASQAITARGDGVYHGKTETVSFHEWERKYPKHAQELEERFSVLEKRRTAEKEDEKYYAMREKEAQEAREKFANTSTEAFVSIGNDQYRMRYEDSQTGKAYLVTIKENGSDVQTSIGSRRWQRVRPAKGSFVFTVQEEGMREKSTWTIHGGNLSSSKLSPEQRRMIQAVMTTPMMEDASGRSERFYTGTGVARILNLYKEAGSYNGRHFYRELRQELDKLYANVKPQKRQTFLNELYSSLERKNILVAENTDDVIDSLKNFAYLYK